MNGPVPTVDDLVEAALSGDSGLDPRSSQEPEKVASGDPADICDMMEKVASELEDWAMSHMEGAEALSERAEQDWEVYQQDRMYKIALARTLTETIAAVSGTEAIREANWGETIKKASAVGAEQDKTSTSKRSLFLAAQAKMSKPVSEAAQAAERVVEKAVKKAPVAKAKRSGGKASPYRTAAAVGIPAAGAGGYALGSRSN